MGELAEEFGGGAELCGDFIGDADLFTEILAGFFEAYEGGIGELSDGGVFAGFFTHLLFGGGDVEDVVDDLESEADGAAVGVDGLEGDGVGIGAESAHAAGATDEGAGLHAVDLLELGKIAGGGGAGLFGFFGVAGVEDLTADHSFTAGGKGEFFDETECEFWVGDFVGDDFKGHGVEGVAGEDGEGVAVDFVVGGATATEIIVVHGGKVVVNEREAVDHFDGGGGCEGGLEICAADGLMAEESEGGADSFAGAEEGVSHGFHEFGGDIVEGIKVLLEVGIGGARRRLS